MRQRSVELTHADYLRRLRIVAVGGLLLAAISANADGIGNAPPALAAAIWSKMAQLPRYSASGTHQCGAAADKRTCVVSGLFNDCNDAAIALRTRDCCPTTQARTTSTRFTLNYCIPQMDMR